jgi:pentatricopeptide repeat domain-containing protein 1
MLDGIQRRDLKANAVTFNTLLRGYARRGRVDDALQFYTRMTKLGVQPSVVTFNTLLLACSRSGNIGTANQVLARMQALGVTPDVVTVTSLISCASRIGDVASASAFASKALNEWRLVLDAPAYNALLTCLAFANKHEEATALLARMRAAGVQPTLASFGSLVAGAARAGDLDRALAAYRDACASGIMPDVRMYDVLLDACVRAGRFEMGVDLLSDMEQRGTALPEDLRGKYRRLLETLAATPAPLSMRGAGRVPRRTQSGTPGGRVPVAAPGSMSGIERLKWWLGLPSKYYSE